MVTQVSNFRLPFPIPIVPPPPPPPAVPQCPIGASAGALDSMVSVLVQMLLLAQCNISQGDNLPPDFADEALANGVNNFDFVVVGGGTAGCVLASRLSENPNWKVLLVEAGGDPAQESKVPGLGITLSKSDTSYNYTTEPNGRACQAFQCNKCYWPTGKGVGGSSLINNMLYLRGNRQDYDKWCAAGATNWCYDDLLPHFEKSVKPVGSTTFPLGHLVVDKFEMFENEYAALVHKAAEELRQPKIKEFKDGAYLGYSDVKGTIENGQRVSAAKAYLAKLNRPNLKIIKNAQVTKLNFEKYTDRVTSIDIDVREQFSLQVNVSRDVILTAGCIETAKLLMLSGIGPKEVLNPLHIPVVQDLPVGKNLQDLVMGYLAVKLEASTKHTHVIINDLYKYLMQREGPLAGIGLSSIVGFIKTDTNASNPYPDIEITHILLHKGDIKTLEIYFESLRVKDEFKQPFIEAIATHDIIVFGLILLNPKSVGSLTINSPHFYDAPIIDANYFQDPRDIEVLVKSVKYIEKFLKTKALRSKKPSLIRFAIKECDKWPRNSDRYWKCYFKYFSSTASQQVGTVKMGSVDDPTAVVTPQLLVKGTDNIRVADASIMPCVPSCNSDGPMAAVAEKSADIIREDWSRMCDC